MPAHLTDQLFGKEEAKTVQINLRFTPSEKEIIAQIAADHGRTRSDGKPNHNQLFRDALKFYMSKGLPDVSEVSLKVPDRPKRKGSRRKTAKGRAKA